MSKKPTIEKTMGKPDHKKPRSPFSIVDTCIWCVGIIVVCVLVCVLYINGNRATLTSQGIISLLEMAALVCVVSAWGLFTTIWVWMHQNIRVYSDKGLVVIDQHVPWWINPFNTSKPDVIDLKQNSVDTADQNLLQRFFKYGDIKVIDNKGKGSLIRFLTDETVNAILEAKSRVESLQARQLNSALRTEQLLAQMAEQWAQQQNGIDTTNVLLGTMLNHWPGYPPPTQQPPPAQSWTGNNEPEPSSIPTPVVMRQNPDGIYTAEGDEQ